MTQENWQIIVHRLAFCVGTRYKNVMEKTKTYDEGDIYEVTDYFFLEIVNLRKLRVLLIR